MRWLNKVRMRLQMLLTRGRAGERLEAELQFHLDQQIAENRAAGMSGEEARYAALRSFGNPTALRAETRANWSWNNLESVLRDARIGVRSLRRAPGFAFTAIAVMALCLGAAIALLTVVRAVLLKPLPYRDSGRLVMLYGQNDAHDPRSENVVAPADFYDWQKGARGFEQMAIWRWTGFNFAGNSGELPEFLNAVTCSWNLFPTLGVDAAVGRRFAPADDRQGAPLSVILSWSLFERRFAGDRSIVGQTIRLNARPYVVLGVMPREFSYPDQKVQLWVPFQLDNRPDLLPSHYNHSSYVVGRLRPGVSLAAATQEVSAIEHQIYVKFHGDGPVAQAVLAKPLIDDVIEDVKTPLYTLLAAVACLLLIACLNLSNLLVARGAARRRETAIRTALGCSRLGLLRQQMTESLLLCGAGAAVGILVAWLTVRWLLFAWAGLPRTQGLHPDAWVVFIAAGITLLAGLMAGLLPGLSGTGRGLLAALQEGARGAGGKGLRANLRRTLLTAEVALTVVLLISAGLLLRSFQRLRGDSLGCTTNNVLTMNYFLRGDQYTKPEQIVSLDTQLLGRVRALPGVRGAGLTNVAPGGGYYGDTGFTIVEHPPQKPGEDTFVVFRTADPGYFSALQIPLIRGRFFADDERLEHDRFAIVNQEFVRQFLAQENPLGRHVHMQWRSDAGENYEIVGVVGNTLYELGRPAAPMVWLPILSGIYAATSDNTLVVRTAGNPETMALPIQKVLAGLDPDLPVKEVLTMDQMVGESTAARNLTATVVLAFAVLSLILAAVGLYGVLAYLVTQRTTEIGVRLALGAERENVLRLVLLDGLRPALLGLALGIAGAAAATRWIASLLFGTEPLDPAVFTLVAITLLATAALACLLPAWQASRLDPMTALRTE
ncbi:MAG TPA: ABC transporter permease [Acidobacteriaceae bacterium]